jgi:hypothetical protein
MKVYLVVDTCGDGVTTAIFSTREKAETYIAGVEGPAKAAHDAERATHRMPDLYPFYSHLDIEERDVDSTGGAA